MIRLLSTDFDGTLINHEGQPPVEPAFFALIERLRSQGIQWAVNTGRTLWHIEEGLKNDYRFPVEPDYMLVEERDLYHRGTDGNWQPYGNWNERSARDHDELFYLAGSLLAEVLRMIEGMPGAQPIYDEGRFIGAVTSDEDQMDKLCSFLTKLRTHLPIFAFQRNTIYVRFCHVDYHKGSALGELARKLGLVRDNIFAAGDHYNDLSMLDGRFAKWIACPSNSVEEVKLTVRTAGGYIADGVASVGVIEALKFFGVE